MGGRRVERAQVLAWEDRRIDAAAKKLGVAAPRLGDIAERREALLRAKLELGSQEIRRRLARDTRWADRVARAQARVSRQRRRSVAELRVSGGSAADFVAWFDSTTNAVDPTAMLRACPDHFDSAFGARGQEVLETTGSSPFAALFFIDYADVSSLLTPPDASFPYQVTGVARAQDGTAIGGVRHQFRDTEDGFHARLTVEFPLPTLPTMVAGPRWHLACEFSNWIESATTAGRQ
ncbi:hypothetical protein GFY24_31900 [Nocardia sp. SYP-A9097]|nr:hypothetical protein [Nocardia sp. SYP-A9097]